MKKVLVVSLTKFYGGGESFIASHLQNIDGIAFYYLIACEQLYEALATQSKFLLIETSLFSVVRSIKKIVSENLINAVVLNGGRSLFLAPFIYRHSACAGIRHTLNASVDASVFYRAAYIGALNLSYCFMKKIVHVSQKSLSEQFLAKRKAMVIYNGVSAKSSVVQKIAGVAKNFLFVGRMAKEKGVDVLIDSFSEICKNDSSVHLHLVGNGEIDENYPHHEHIHFEGFSTNVEQYYRAANWYISLTSRENCSISVLDALSYGLPVITTSVGGNPELVQSGYNGFIIGRNKNDVFGLFDSKIKNISDEQYRVFSSNALKSFEEKFDLQKQKKAYKNLLEML